MWWTKGTWCWWKKLKVKFSTANSSVCCPPVKQLPVWYCHRKTHWISNHSSWTDGLERELCVSFSELNAYAWHAPQTSTKLWDTSLADWIKQLTFCFKDKKVVIGVIGPISLLRIWAKKATESIPVKIFWLQVWQNQERWWKRGICHESSCRNFILSLSKISAVEPSELMRVRNDEVKLLGIFWARCQKFLEELE